MGSKNSELPLTNLEVSMLPAATVSKAKFHTFHFSVLAVPASV